MAVVLEASLGFFTGAQVLDMVARAGQAGTIEIGNAARRISLGFRKGLVVWVTGTDAVDVASDLAAFDFGAIRILDDLATPDGAKAVELQLTALAADAQRLAEERSRLLALYPSDDVVFTVNPQPKPQSSEVISLRPEEFGLLFQIGNAGKSLAQIRAEAKKPPLELYGTLQRLQAAGLISASGGGADMTVMAPVAPKPTAAPPATPPPSPVTRSTRKTRVGELKPKTVAEAKPLIATLTTETGTMHPLLEEETTIGRDERNAISVPHGSVSGRHARILRAADGFAIEDLGSRNGTFLNSEPVTERRPLADGDVVRLGKILLTFNIAKEMRPRDTTKPESVR